jgi:hypothetical protein
LLTQEIEYLREDEVDIDEGEDNDMEDFGADFSDGDDDDGSSEAGTSGAVVLFVSVHRHELRRGFHTVPSRVQSPPSARQLHDSACGPAIVAAASVHDRNVPNRCSCCRRR